MDVHGILLVDKPRGVTSHDVVARARRLLHTRKIGHAGTLDPAAEGLLILGVGRATKLLGTLTDHTKRYVAHVVLGVGSVSGDIEGPVIFENSARSQPSDAEVAAMLRRFTGEIKQIPPAHSAIKVEGQPLYRRARQGAVAEIPSRRVHIAALDLIEYRYPSLYLDIRCSAGTYIRSLARDLGAALGTSAYLQELVRTESGRHRLSEAWSMTDLEQGLRAETFERFALHPSIVDMPAAALALDPDGANAWYDGRPVSATGRSGLERTYAFRTDGSWLGTGIRERENWLPKVVVRG